MTPNIVKRTNKDAQWNWKQKKRVRSYSEKIDQLDQSVSKIRSKMAKLKCIFWPISHFSQKLPATHSYRSVAAMSKSKHIGKQREKTKKKENEKKEKGDGSHHLKLS